MEKNMITIDEIKRNLEGMRGELCNLKNDVIEKFEDYNYEGESNIKVIKLSPDNTQILVYADFRGSPELKLFLTITGDGEYLVKKIEMY